jgi:phytoene dehydrogenase-like protein
MPKLQARAQIPGGPSRHVYDVIVVGGQIGGAVAAALLAKRGYRVMHVEHDGMGHGYAHEGWLLPYAPFVAPPLKFLPQAQDVLAELGLATTVQRALKAHPSLQLVMPEHRLDLSVDEQRRSAELHREFGEAASAVDMQMRLASQQHEATDGFFRNPHPLPPAGIFDRWALRRAVAANPALHAEAELAKEGPTASLVRGMGRFLHYLDAPEGPLPLTRPLSQVLHAPHRFPGGREGLRELLYKKLQDLGGMYMGRDTSEAYVVEALSFEGGKLVGVKLVGSENQYLGSHFVVALDSPVVRRVITDKKKNRKLAEILDLPTTKKFLFTVNWIIRADAIPRGMGELLLLETPGEELGPLLIQVHGARRLESKVDDETMRIVCAAAFVPTSARDLGEGHLQQLVERMGAAMERLMPFSKEHRLLVSAPYLDAGGVRGSRLLPHPLYTFESTSELGVTGLPQQTPVKNLFLASREVLPGLGLEGEFIAGARAASLVQEQLKKRDPLKH